MKQLETKFIGRGEVSGVLFTQLFRFNDLCLYERTGGTYEVIKARHQKESRRMIDGKEIVYEEKERYPVGDEWAGYEFACNSIERAIFIFNESAKVLKYNIILTKENMET